MIKEIIPRNGKVIRLPRDTDLEYARFGLTLEHIGEQTWKNPVSRMRGMSRPTGVKLGIVEFDVNTTQSRGV